MKISNIIKGFALSAFALGFGFLAIALPFRMFNILSGDGMRIMFIVELIVYMIVGMIFLAIQDKKNQQKAKANKRHEQRQIKVQDCIDNWYNIAA